MPSPTPFIHSSTKCSASKPSSAWAAARMSPATASTSSNRSRSYRLWVKPRPVRAMPDSASAQRIRSWRVGGKRRLTRPTLSSGLVRDLGVRGAEHEPVVQAELEPPPHFEHEGVTAEDVRNRCGIEAVVLVDIHPIDDPRADHHAEDLVDARRWRGDDEAAAGLQMLGDRLGPEGEAVLR